MAFGPKMIEEIEFKTVAFRGYRVSEVDEFLDEMADEVDKLQIANRALEEKVAKLSEREKSVTDMEQTLRDTLITAQRAAEDVVKAAKEKATAILQDSELERKRIIGEAEQRALTAGSQLEAINRDITTIKAAIRKALTEQLRQLEEAYPQDTLVLANTAPAQNLDSTRVFSIRDTRDGAFVDAPVNITEERLPQDSNEVIR